jgi:NAD(P)-dependent dehydrogenase (short-subunit alcohol dehydrogenase family)
MQHVQERIAIVTGGASGLGLATSQKFIEKGIKTIIIGRNKQKLAQAKSMLGELAICLEFDINDLSSIPLLIQQIVQKHGRIDILVNNAGINLKKELLDVTDEEFLEIMHTNLVAVFSLSREVSRIMKNQEEGGSIVMISSMAARYGIPKVIAYTASKSAIEGMTKSMAVELAPHGIRVNCVAPGFISTDMSAKALNNDPQRKGKVLDRTPLGKLGDPVDIAEAVYYFSSNAAKYVTGTSLAIDGGNSIGF